MANSPAPGFEDLVTCPYNKSHQILRERIQTHLVKCKRANPDIILKICPYNSTHHIKEAEFKNHVENCPDKATMDRFMFSVDAGTSSTFKMKDEVSNNVVYDDEENWDDMNVASYNPNDYAAKNAVLRTRAVIGMKPAERRRFRQDEVVRMNNID